MKLTLGSFSCFNIEIAHSNFTFQVRVRSGENCQNFRETSTPLGTTDSSLNPAMDALEIRHLDLEHWISQSPLLS